MCGELHPLECVGLNPVGNLHLGGRTKCRGRVTRAGCTKGLAAIANGRVL